MLPKKTVNRKQHRSIIHGGHNLQKLRNPERHSGIAYEVTAATSKMVMCTDVINYLNPNTDRPVA